MVRTNKHVCGKFRKVFQPYSVVANEMRKWVTLILHCLLMGAWLDDDLNSSPTAVISITSKKYAYFTAIIEIAKVVRASFCSMHVFSDCKVYLFTLYYFPHTPFPQSTPPAAVISVSTQPTTTVHTCQAVLICKPRELQVKHPVHKTQPMFPLG